MAFHAQRRSSQAPWQFVAQHLGAAAQLGAAGNSVDLDGTLTYAWTRTGGWPVALTGGGSSADGYLLVLLAARALRQSRRAV